MRIWQPICANPVPTAQAAIRILLEELPVTLADAQVAVIGYGRIGRVLTDLLKAMGAEVCVASRGAAHTAQTMPTGEYGPFLSCCDAVVNTAPAPVLPAEALERTRADCLILDLASAPGGVDREAAARLHRRVRWELGLPGREFPVSAGRIIQAAVMRAMLSPPCDAGG